MTDELRAKFENWWLRNGDPFDLHKTIVWKTWQAAHASRDAEVEALKRDAERYRWLRQMVFDHRIIASPNHQAVMLSDKRLDAAIDDAMAKESAK